MSCQCNNSYNGLRYHKIFKASSYDRNGRQVWKWYWLYRGTRGWFNISDILMLVYLFCWKARSRSPVHGRTARSSLLGRTSCLVTGGVTRERNATFAASAVDSLSAATTSQSTATDTWAAVVPPLPTCCRYSTSTLQPWWHKLGVISLRFRDICLQRTAEQTFDDVFQSSRCVQRDDDMSGVFVLASTNLLCYFYYGIMFHHLRWSALTAEGHFDDVTVQKVVVSKTV